MKGVCEKIVTLPITLQPVVSAFEGKPSNNGSKQVGDCLCLRKNPDMEKKMGLAEWLMKALLGP